MLSPVLRQAWESDAAEQYYEDLCLSYVAMTRARQGLYLLSRSVARRVDAVILTVCFMRHSPEMERP